MSIADTRRPYLLSADLRHILAIFGTFSFHGWVVCGVNSEWVALRGN
jgi:hypothetical protein